MVKQHFFTTSEVLLGKSMCDLCLNDPKRIQKALSDYDNLHSEKFDVEGTILYDIVENDNIRRDYLE